MLFGLKTDLSIWPKFDLMENKRKICKIIFGTFLMQASLMFFQKL